MTAFLLFFALTAHAKTGHCNCFATDAASIKYWGSHAPAASCTGFARNDALTKARVECQRYSSAPESCATTKASCQFNLR